MLAEFQRGLKTQRTASGGGSSGSNAPGSPSLPTATATDGSSISAPSLTASAATHATFAQMTAPMPKTKKSKGGDNLVMTMVSDGKGGKVMAHERRKPRRWTKQEDESLRRAVAIHGAKHWKDIARSVETRNHMQCLQRWKTVLRPGLKKGYWGPEEDDLLRRLVGLNGEDKWGEVASQISNRTTKQCRERWWHHLDPCVKKGGWSEEEDVLILEQHAKIGNRWSAISKMLPGRTENAVKIRWKSLHCRGRTRGDRFAGGGVPMKTGLRQGGWNFAVELPASIRAPTNEEAQAHWCSLLRNISSIVQCRAAANSKSSSCASGITVTLRLSPSISRAILDGQRAHNEADATSMLRQGGDNATASRKRQRRVLPSAANNSSVLPSAESTRKSTVLSIEDL